MGVYGLALLFAVIGGVISYLIAKNCKPGDYTAPGKNAAPSAAQMPQAGYPPSAQPPAAENGPGVLLVRFSIDKLNERSGVYGFQSGKLVGQAVPPVLLEGMTISDGDSAATLGGREYVCLVSISTSFNRSLLKEKIEPLILANEEIRACGASPLTRLSAFTDEPLVIDGVVRNGRIEGSGGWCANGFLSAWKEAAAQQGQQEKIPKTI